MDPPPSLLVNADICEKKIPSSLMELYLTTDSLKQRWGLGAENNKRDSLLFECPAVLLGPDLDQWITRG